VATIISRNTLVQLQRVSFIQPVVSIEGQILSVAGRGIWLVGFLI